MASSNPENATSRKKDKGSLNKKAKRPLPSAGAATEQDDRENANGNWAYEPPPGAVLYDPEYEGEEFDWDAVKADEDIELWLFRIPEAIKPKYLDGVQIDSPSGSGTTKVGEFIRKSTSYDIWSIGNGDEQPVGGEELKGLSCLLPRKKKQGKLYKAPKPIARQFLISAQLEHQTPPADQPDSIPVYKNPPRHSYPKELLKHNFVPYGSHTSSRGATIAEYHTDIQIDAIAEKETSTPAPTVVVSDGSPADSKGKKRKGEKVASPKQSKKAKTTS